MGEEGASLLIAPVTGPLPILGEDEVEWGLLGGKVPRGPWSSGPASCGESGWYKGAEQPSCRAHPHQSRMWLAGPPAPQHLFCVCPCVPVCVCVCLCVYVHVCICMCVCLCVCLHMCVCLCGAHMCVCAHVSVSAYVCICTCVCPCVCVPICVCARVCVSACVSTRVCVCLCVCLPVCVFRGLGRLRDPLFVPRVSVHLVCF